MARNLLSPVDTAWLRMEDPTNLMMISGVLVFGAPIDYDLLKTTLEYRMVRPFGRFRQRVVRPAFGAPYWEDDPDFDLSYHFQRASLPPPGDKAALQNLASLLASTQLDLARPLWQLHLVEQYGDGCAVICRLHHCIGDGLALVHVLLSLTDEGPEVTWPAIQPRAPRRGKRSPLNIALRPARAALKTTGKAANALAEECRKVRAEPARALDLPRLGLRATMAAGRLVFLWPDPQTAFKGPLGVSKRAAWTAPIPLQEIKTIGKGLGGTVNDVLLTAVAGALRRYLQGRDEPVRGLNVRAVVPVDLRKPGTEAELGNKFGLVFLPLPLGVPEPGERLHELKRRMDALKGSLEAPVAFGILTGIGRAPEPVQDLVVSIFGLKGTGVMTNVIGPRQQLYLAGAPLDSLMFWVPQSGHLGMGVSILSYAGRVWMGIITDESLVPDPEAIVASIQDELDALLTMAQGGGMATPEAEPPTLQEITAKLDKTLAALNALLESEGQGIPHEAVAVTSGHASSRDGPQSGVSSGDVGRCQALTKAGKQCKNRALPGSDYCRVHQKA
jgi:diacylglycerol O-acyltransferase